MNTTRTVNATRIDARMKNRSALLWVGVAAALAMFSIGSLNAADADNASPDELFKAGGAAFQAGKFDEAAQKFEAVLAAGPEGESLETILFTLGSTYFNQKNWEKAEEYCKRCFTEFPAGKNKTKALLLMAQIQTQTGRKSEAAKTLELAAGGNDEMAMSARLTRATALMEMGKNAEASAILQTMIASGLKDDLSVQAGMALLDSEVKQGKFDEARKLLSQIQAAAELIENPLQLDLLAVKIGDGLLAAGETQKALRIYAIVRSKQVVGDLLKDRISGIDKKIAFNTASLQTNPRAIVEFNAANARLRDNQKRLKAALDQFIKMPDIESALRLRQAKAYEELDQKWETLLIWERLLESCKDPAILEDALFGMASSYIALGRTDDASSTLDRYIAQYPKGKYTEQADYLKGCFILEGGDFAKAETVFGTRIAKGGDSAIAADMQFLLANAQFAQAAADPQKSENYKKAIENYKKYLGKFSNGKFAEECSYRIPLSYFQLGDYSHALDGFEAYIKMYPTGTFAGDGGYRIALCYQAANEYDEVLKRCAQWLKLHAASPMEAEVLCLQGDAYAGKKMSDEAADSYRRSVDRGDTDVLLQYALLQANEQYQKKERWDEIATLFSRFVEQHPEHPAAVGAIYWVSKAKLKKGNTEEAKRYLAESILKNITDRNKDAVEQLLTQLAQTCSKRPRRPFIHREAAPSPAPEAAAQTASEAAPVQRPKLTPLPPYDADADLAQYLNANNVGSSPLAEARLRYVQAQLAGFTKKPDRQKDLLASIYREFSPAQLSAMLLAECGDIALDKCEIDKAQAFYKELLTSFPKSDLLEYAYYGMGGVALATNKPQDALQWFNDAVDKASADAKLADITYGKGCAFLMQGKLDDAKKIFNQVAATKEWRGPLTAKAILSLGDMEEKQGNTAGAIQYYQRVFVAYQRYPDLVISAYLKAADGFIKLGEPAKAAAHLREMLSNPRLADSPLAEQARKKLEGLPAELPIKSGSGTSLNSGSGKL